MNPDLYISFAMRFTLRYFIHAQAVQVSARPP